MYKNFVRNIVLSTFVLMFILLLIRGRVMYYGYFSLFTAPKSAPYILAAAWHDWIFVICLALIFIFTGYFFKKKPGCLRGASIFYTGLSVLLILTSLINVTNVHMLGTPFNYQWLYYSDFLDNADSKQAIAENLNKRFIADFAILSTALLGGSRILAFALKHFIISEKNQSKALLFSIILMFTYFIIGRTFIENKNLNYNVTANPIVAFSESAIKAIANHQPNLFTLEIPEDFEPFPTPEIYHQTSSQNEESKIKNVILFVLESVPAEYVAGYERQYKVTPTIEKYLDKSIVFSDIYAHTPMTNNSMVSILGSIYPMISFKSITAEHPDIKWPTISSELKNEGFKTSFFHASDNRFQKMDEFLSYRKFDLINDYKTIQCDSEVMIGSTENWKYLDGVDEECMADAFISWMDKEEGPFFSTIWTMQTHYPYFTSGPEKTYVADNPELNRYLNALNHSDAVLGKILKALEERDILDSTLVVITGDHGEAFGRHNQFGHAVHIYEENVRIPLIFLNPVLFKKEKYKVVGGQVDLAPTIMDILKKPSPKEWQGTSLLNKERKNRTYFFNPRSNYLFGYRTPEYKIIYDATDNKTMIFDLSADPKEQTSLADQKPDLVELSLKRLAQWVQYHTEMFNHKVKEKD